MRQVLILAGGKGSRLGKLTQTIPKPLLKFDGKNSTLSILVHKCMKENFDEIIILAGYLPKTIENFHSELDPFVQKRVKVVYEKNFLGTGGAINNAYKHLEEKFLVINGDTLLNINYEAFYNDSDMKLFNACLAIKKFKENSKCYGNIKIDQKHIIGFYEKEEICSKKDQYINLGCYMLTKKIFIKDNIGMELSLEKDILPKLSNEKKVGFCLYNKDFIDIGTPESLILAKEFSYDC